MSSNSSKPNSSTRERTSIEPASSIESVVENSQTGLEGEKPSDQVVMLEDGAAQEIIDIEPLLKGLFDSGPDESWGSYALVTTKGQNQSGNWEVSHNPYYLNFADDLIMGSTIRPYEDFNMAAGDQELQLPTLPQFSNLHNTSSSQIQPNLGFSSQNMRSGPKMRESSFVSAPSTRFALFAQDRKTFGSQMGYGFLYQNLRSYPRMMLEEADIPPFVHHSFKTSEVRDVGRIRGGDPREESLAICKAIVQMHSAMSKNSAAFVWRTLEMEQMRLQAEVS
jgi:hypothetical protein